MGKCIGNLSTNPLYLIMFKEERNEYFWHRLLCSDDLLPPNKQARATMQSCHGYNSNWSYLASAFLCRDVTKKILRQEKMYSQAKPNQNYPIFSWIGLGQGIKENGQISLG